MSLLIKRLAKKGFLKKEKVASLEYEIKVSEKTEEEIILKRKIISEDGLFDLKSKILKISLKDVVPSEIQLGVLELIPEDSARYYQMIPLSKKGNLLDVGMIYPEDLKAQEALRFLAREKKFKYHVFLIKFTTLKNLLKRYKGLKREINKALGELEEEFKEEKNLETSRKNVSEIEKVVAEAPISKIVAVALRHAVEGKASDVHIEPTATKLRIRFRLDGSLHSSIFLPKKIHSAVVARIKILSNLRIDEKRMPQDGRFSIMVGDRSIDFRVSTFPSVLGEIVALRVLNPDEGLKGFDSLGLVGRNLKSIKSAAKKPYGMILATGPTGCGKSTTLYSILRLLNKEEVNIMTLEDPVEYYMEGVNQSQIKPEIGYTFASGLRHILRHDPDIIMVGEIRDEETASLAIHAALTGHIVLSTVHTNNAAGAIPRFIDLGIKPFLISPTLNIIMAQRLVRRLCVHCKKKVKPAKKIRDMIFKSLSTLPPDIKKRYNVPSSPEDIWVWEAKGCKKCNNTGYAGRIGIFEILKMTEQLSAIVLKNPSETRISQEAKRQKMIDMRKDGLLKVLNGETSVDEVVAATEIM